MDTAPRHPKVTEICAWARKLKQKQAFWFRTDIFTKPTSLPMCSNAEGKQKQRVGDYRLMRAWLLSSAHAAGLKLILFLICNSKGQSKQKIRIKSGKTNQFHPQGAAGRSRPVTGVTQALSQAPGDCEVRHSLSLLHQRQLRPHLSQWI